ncbi:hypothetical protein [Sphingomonas kyungheensis]|uniref:Uncharacterized protein n=1 Tax=Sphingomonas kyungheensis TaxID=1069987 RepID=A0ABU8H4K7_9SPHN
MRPLRAAPLQGAAAAHATLTRGATFLAALADRPMLAGHWPDGAAARPRARFVANCLRELDRFLHTLLDELGSSAGQRVDREQRNTANKLRDYGGPALTAGADRLRLLALGRSSACLIHCNGLVRRPDVAGGDGMTAGWRGTAGETLRRYPLGDRLAPGPAELRDVCRFYERLGNGLMRGARDDAILLPRPLQPYLPQRDHEAVVKPVRLAGPARISAGVLEETLRPGDRI